MKYLKTYENFNNQQYVVGDTVKLSNDEAALIIKANSNNSYIVRLLRTKEEIEIRGNSDDERLHIIDLMQSNSEPALDTGFMDNPGKAMTDRISNDFVINC
jgi:regulation of enolase protein 1 (concanavalin A-like superfamily)